MKNPVRIISALVAIIIIDLFLISDFTFGEFKVSFLDIGQGDSIYIRTPDDYNILIDGGPSMSVLEEISETIPIYSKDIDVLFLTHPHSDHVNGLVEVLNRYRVKKVMIVGTPSRNPYYKEFLKIIRDQNIPLYFPVSKEDIKVGRFLFLDIIWPDKKLAGVEFENLNNASLSMRVLFKNHSVVLTGDAEEEQEKEMAASGNNLKGDFLKAGHHGSRTASTEAFLDEVDPETVIIQCGKENSFGHPHKETLLKLLNRGIETRRNDIEGRVEFTFSQF